MQTLLDPSQVGATDATVTDIAQETAELPGRHRSNNARVNTSGSTMNNLLKHKAFLDLLFTYEPTQQQAFLASTTPEQIHCICNCINNCFRKRYVLPQKVINKIRPYARHIQKTADENWSVRR